jgi:hypothetical protein
MPSSSPSASPTPLKCDYTIIDFDTDGRGEATGNGYVSPDAWKVYGVQVNAFAFDGGYTPGDHARFLDTNPTNPGLLFNDAFGSPNEACDTSGPGVGSGGLPSKAGENCQELGKVLIIQSSNIPEAKSHTGGGEITFSFDHSVESVVEIGLLNVCKTGATVILEKAVSHITFFDYLCVRIFLLRSMLTCAFVSLFPKGRFAC